MCVYNYTIHFSLVISVHFKLYGTCWSHICIDATMKRSIAFRTIPQLTLSGPGPRSPFAHSWRSGKRYCVLSTPPKVNICSHGRTSLVHYPATSEYNCRDRSILWILGGPIHVGSLWSWIEIVRIDFGRGSYELTWPTQPTKDQVGWAPPKTG